jgi:hypothetical protein
MQSIHNPEQLSLLQTRIDALRANARPLWGEMNLLQMLAHCIEPFYYFLNEKEFSQFPPEQAQKMVKAAILEKAPFMQHLPTHPYFNKQNEAISEEQENLQETLKFYLRTLASRPDTYAFGPHPAAGHFTREEIGFMAFKHTDHHLRQFGV